MKTDDGGFVKQGHYKLIVGLLGAILTLMLLYTLWAASSLVIPLLLAMLFYLVLSPAVSRLHRLGLPRALATGVLVLVIFGTIGFAGWLLVDPASEWLVRAPYGLSALQDKLSIFVEPLRTIEWASQEVSEMAGEASEEVQRVTLEDNALQVTLFQGTSQFLAGIAIVVVLTTFLLVTGGRIGRDLAGLLPTFSAVRRALAISAAVKRELSLYLLTITLINTGLGLTTTLVLWALGVPNPSLWGVMMGLLNFIPYLGPATALVVIFIVSLLSFESATQAVVPPLSVFALNVVESNFITPTLVAMRLSLNTVMVVISLVLWGWLWGVAGMLIAVPLLAVAKIVCDHVPGLEAVGRVFGERHETKPTRWLEKLTKRLGLRRPPATAAERPALRPRPVRPVPRSRERTLRQLG